MDTSQILELISSSSTSTSQYGNWSPFQKTSPFDLLKVKKDEKAFESLKKEISEDLRKMEAHMEFLASAHNAMTQEMRASQRTADSFGPSEQVADEFTSHLGSASNFLRVAFMSLSELRNLQAGFHELVKNLDPGPMVLPDGEVGQDWDGMQKARMINNAYGPTMNKFIGALLGIETTKGNVADTVFSISSKVEAYYKALLKRHSTDGYEIHGNPIKTDVALSIFANVDSHGEIETDGDVNKVSAYSMRKAQILVRALEEDPLKGFITHTGTFLRHLEDGLRKLWRASERLDTIFRTAVMKAKETYEGSYRRTPSKADFDTAIQMLKDLDPDLVPYKDRAVLLTAEERFQTKFMNETLAEMVRLMTLDQEGTRKLVEYVLKRKHDLKSHDRDENSFYVCRIGDGNRFQQKPPGTLEVVPGERPTVNINEIWGSGFDEIREFLDSIEMSSKWHDLFVATSPSKTADKSNMLMIGPQGCGKSQAMRGVGADAGSIGIFAQGSDFLTCWMGEAEKNPKRLFQAAVKLQKETGKQVFIMIDECDSVMKKQENKSHGEVDLTLEFQILMDGVVHYPHITIIGATNRPGLIPMPMIRRFSKVIIVGELEEEDRISVLKHYVDFMPTHGFTDRTWKSLALKLDGATGDVLRKIVDAVWRQKMTWFVKNQAERAEAMLKWLNDGVKFDVTAFDKKKRREFKDMLGPFVKIEPKDVEASTKSHLRNVAIQGEIKTAKQTYQEAHDLLDSLDNSGLILAKA